MAMMVVLLDDPNRRFCVGQQLLAKLAAAGVTSVALVRDAQTVGIVLEGWLFDPARSGDALRQELAVAPGGRTLHPFLELAVSAATEEGGSDVREVSHQLA